MTPGQQPSDESSSDLSNVDEIPYLVSRSEAADNVPTTDDMYEEKAMLLVEQLIDRGVIQLDDREPLLYHEPSGRVFESALNAAHFHKGWAAASED